MKVLLTGATSGLGRNAASWMLEQGWQVRAVGRNAQAGAELQRLGAEFVPQDLGRASPDDGLRLVAGCDAVWHCAARSAPWGAAADFHRDNVLATQTLAHAAGQQGVPRFVHISTPAVYFDFQHHRHLPESYRARRFANHYARSKWQAEQVIAAAVQQHPRTCWTVLRPRALYGPHDRVILPRLLQQLDRRRGILRLPRGGTPLCDLSFVLNVVHAMALATTQPGLPSGATFNISDQHPRPLAEMLLPLLHQLLGAPPHIRALPYPLLYGVATLLEGMAALTGTEPRLTRYSVGAVSFDMTLDPHQAQTVLGYRPVFTPEQGTARTADWLRQQGW